MEVEEEYELDTMKDFKTEWFKRQAAMMKEWEEQVAEEWVRWNKKEEVLKEKREEKRREARVLLKIQALAASKAHLKGLVPNAIESLTEVAFPDKKGTAIKCQFLPQIFGEVQKHVQAKTGAEREITNMMRRCTQARAEKQASARQVLVDKWAVMEARRLEEAKIRRGNVRIYIPGEDGKPVPVGPVQINSEETMAQIEERVHEWLKENKPNMATAFPWGVTMCLNNENGEPVPVEEAAQLFEAKAGQISMSPKEEPPPAPEEDAGDAGEEQGEGAVDDGEPVDG